MRTRVLAVAAALAVVLTGCGSSADNDRDAGNGKKPDQISDATKVQVFRNADNVPNVVRFCVDFTGFWSTLSGTDNGAKPPQLLRAIELDVPYCGRKEG